MLISKIAISIADITCSNVFFGSFHLLKFDLTTEKKFSFGLIVRVGQKIIRVHTFRLTNGCHIWIVMWRSIFYYQRSTRRRSFCEQSFSMKNWFKRSPSIEIGTISYATWSIGRGDHTKEGNIRGSASLARSLQPFFCWISLTSRSLNRQGNTVVRQLDYRYVVQSSFLLDDCVVFMRGCPL